MMGVLRSGGEIGVRGQEARTARLWGGRGGGGQGAVAMEVRWAAGWEGREEQVGEREAASGGWACGACPACTACKASTACTACWAYSVCAGGVARTGVWGASAAADGRGGLGKAGLWLPERVRQPRAGAVRRLMGVQGSLPATAVAVLDYRAVGHQGRTCQGGAVGGR